jgi:ribose 5-phosphate isomerase B
MLYHPRVRVAIAADHAGYATKEEVKRLLGSLGIPYDDFGTVSTQSVDYPDYAARVAGSVSAGTHDRGILVCGTGIGMAIAANKFAGIRAAPVGDLESARLGRQHNDINVLALSGRQTDPRQALEIVKIFLNTPFDGGRHQRRIDKIAQLEKPSRGGDRS